MQRGGTRRTARALRWCTAALGFLLVPACYFTTSLDGLTTLGADAGTTTEAGDASTEEAAPPIESGPDAPMLDGGSAYAAAVRVDAPIAWYRLDDAAPVVARDEMGRFAGNYKPYATSSFEMGQAGAIANDPSKSVKFTGGSIEVPNAFAFENGANFTFELWIDLQPTIPSEYARVLSMENTPNGYSLHVNDHELRFEMRGGGQSTISRGTTLPVGWAHVAVTYDGQQVTGYVGGVKAFEFASAARWPVRMGPFAIGGASYGGIDDHARGRIDEVAVYDKVLSVDRIAAHFAAGK